MDLKKISKRVMNIPLRYILIFTLINTFFLLYFGNILIRIAFFVICVVILHFFGRLPFADVDPVPFTTGIIYLIFDLPTAAQYAIWTCPAADAITGNFNQWTFVTLGSLLSSLIISSILGFNPIYFLICLILVYNIIRFIVTLYLGSLDGALISTSTNTFIYLIITSLIYPLINILIKIFKG